MQLTNPIIPGFYPDPSVCRVGEDYYLVTSSFEYFPGVPLFHSRDLVHWRQFGHCLTRPSQLPLARARSSGGIYAPTIRWHAGTFYMVTTNVTDRMHFYVSAADPAGEWSEPAWVEQCGIDPSLLFDEGKAYFTSNGPDGIWQCELDLRTGRKLAATRHIWAGAGDSCTEAPHLYRFGDWYYLLVAEGGTEFGHAASIARSRSPWGPFEPCPHNPILTHRNRCGHPLQATGHVELFQAHDGSWWAVFLGIRTCRTYPHVHHLGRETFLAPVKWTPDGWPVIGRRGHVELEMEVEHLLPPHPWPAEPARDDFDQPRPGLDWNFLRNPYPADWSLTARPGWLRLTGSAVMLDDVDSPAFLGRRQRHAECRAATRLDFQPQRAGEQAGLTVLMNERHHYELAVARGAAGREVLVRRRIGDLSAVVVRAPAPAGSLILQVTADWDLYRFAFGPEGGPLTELATAQTRYLSKEVAGGYTGVYLGLYATGHGARCAAPADFDWFDYHPV